MPKGQPKSRRADAERAGEWYLREVCGCVKAERARRTKFWNVDFYNCDCMGKRPDGTNAYAQVTAGGDKALQQRRRKLEKIPWHPAVDTVMVLQLTSTPNPVNRRSKDFWFRVHRYHIANVLWAVESQAHPVPREWFKAWREE